MRDVCRTRSVIRTSKIVDFISQIPDLHVHVGLHSIEYFGDALRNSSCVQLVLYLEHNKVLVIYALALIIKMGYVIFTPRS